MSWLLPRGHIKDNSKHHLFRNSRVHNISPTFHVRKNSGVQTQRRPKEKKRRCRLPAMVLLLCFTQETCHCTEFHVPTHPRWFCGVGLEERHFFPAPWYYQTTPICSRRPKGGGAVSFPLPALSAPPVSSSSCLSLLGGCREP